VKIPLELRSQDIASVESWGVISFSLLRKDVRIVSSTKASWMKTGDHTTAPAQIIIVASLFTAST